MKEGYRIFEGFELIKDGWHQTIKMILILSVFALSACASKQPATIDYATDGTILKTTVAISGKQFAEMQNVKAAEGSNAAYYAAQQAKYSKLTDGRDIALVDAIAALSGSKQPTNYNDALIARSNNNTLIWSKITGGVTNILKYGVGAYLGGKAIDGVVATTNSRNAVLSDAVDNVGDRHTVNNNGDQNQVTFGDESPVTQDNARGIPVNPADVEPISLGGSSTSTSTSSTISTEAACIAAGGEWVADEQRCSDGMGGTL